MPIRWRLAGGSALLTFVILAGFAVLVGVLTSGQVRGQFNDEVRSAAEQLQQELGHKLRFQGNVLVNCNQDVHLDDYAQAEHAQIRIFDANTGELLCTQNQVKIPGDTPLQTQRFTVAPVQNGGIFTQYNYRVAVRLLDAQPIGQLKLLYARPISDVDHTLERVRLFLALGVLGGTILALMAGLLSAARAMRPIAELTDAAGEIERTRDPRLRLPHPEAEDEVAELAGTLEGMLRALDAARAETEATLQRQREFVADASHELRTPLTSVLANLELLAEELRGEHAEFASAALRSTQRMRRLVGDLLLLARADDQRTPARRIVDLAEVLAEAAAELGPMSEEHALTLETRPAAVLGARDELHRLVLNLLQNALDHTPPGTRIAASVQLDEATVTLAVQDDGPGIPTKVASRIFDRFIRGGGDGGGGSGLGLAIVRAVAESHGGSVDLEQPGTGGSRFVVRLPAASPVAGEPATTTPAPPQRDPAGDGAQTSTTTGSTIGRRRSRS